MTKSSWRKLLVAPAVLSLALGGALLTATSASAAPGNLVITTPVEGQTVNSRDVTFSGTAVEGSKIVIHEGSEPEGTVLATVDSVPRGGAWSVDHVYADDAPVDQTVFVDGIVGGSGFSDAQTRRFTLPAAAPTAPPFSVTSPTQGQYLESRTVEVSGTGIPGANVALTPSEGDPTTGILVDDDGNWTGTVTFPADVDRAQSITADQIVGAAGRGSITVDVNLPAAQTLVVTTPKDGETTASRTVTFSGTGTPNSNVSLTGDFPFVQAYVGDAGTWSVDVTFADDATTAQSVRLTQVTSGVGTGDVTVAFSLPAATAQPTPTPTPTPTVDTPVITSPVDGAALVGSTVTFEGTGTPGSNIVVVAVPADSVDDLRAAAQPADPADPIVVGEDGTWTVTAALAPGEYRATAQAVLLDADGQPVLGADGSPVVSGVSNTVAFALTAAPAAQPIGTGTGAGTGPGTTPNGQLAFTGSNAAPVAIGGGLVALAGVALSALAARRRARLG